jgi:hypothetical protein
MKSLTAFLLVAAALFAPTAASAQSSELPDVLSLRPYSADTRHLSREGYVRTLYFEQHGAWITQSDAQALLASQELRRSALIGAER